MKHWVKQSRQSSDIVALYTNILTNDKIVETKLGQFFVANTNKLTTKPTDVFVVREFEGWEFSSGGNIYNEDVTEDEEPIFHYGSYCADGDGFVSVELLVDGSIRLLDQGDYMKDLSPNLEEAIQQATNYLCDEYPNIYDLWFAV